MKSSPGDRPVLAVTRAPQDPIDSWVKQFGPALYRLARAITGSPEAAEDIVQEVFIRGWRTHQRHGKPLPAAWFYKVTRNLCIDHLRRETRRTQAEARRTPRQDPPARAFHDDHLDALAVKDALRSLSERDQICIWLFYYGDWSLNAIAAALAISPAAVKTRVARARKRLRKQWEEGEHV